MPPPLETFPDHGPHCISNGLWVARHLSTPPLPCMARLEAMRKSHVRLLITKFLETGTVKKAESLSLSRILQGRRDLRRHCTDLLTHALL